MVSAKFKNSFKCVEAILFTTALFLSSCSQINNQPEIVNNKPSIDSGIIFSQDSLRAIITTGSDFSGLEKLILEAQTPLPATYFIDSLYPDIHDSTKMLYSKELSQKIPESMLRRSLKNYKKNEESYQFTFQIDTAFIIPLIKNNINQITKNQYAHPMFNTNPIVPKFTQLTPSTKLRLPIDSLRFPLKASRLPNAPRSYRSGTHRGIDFFSNWGTDVRSVADGIIIRSDLSYKEVSPDFRKKMLKRAATLNRTPSDIFNELLLGQAVIIDHGFKLFAGYRAITIYAHLSSIDANIQPGYIITAGEIFGKSGNSGTEPSTLGTRNESHLHWELILQDAGGEYYFGRDLEYESLIVALDRIFEN